MKVMTSEWVSVGHPDKVADAISSYILDRYLEEDPKTRYAVEVQVKDNHVTLGGEVTSKASITNEDIVRFVGEAVSAIGYTHDYAVRWGEDNALDSSKLDVRVFISSQSPDIAQGVDRAGWGDQGIFWGMATNNDDTEKLPLDHYLAKCIGEQLYWDAREKFPFLGLDIKTQVTIVDDKIREVVVAVPMKEDHTAFVEEVVKSAAEFFFPGQLFEIRVNGTGRYVRHSSMGDCGTTGRKLVVDFYGGNCRIGGGSPWTKDGSKADVALNVYARKLAVEFIGKHPDMEKCYVGISSCIGQSEIRVTYYDEKHGAVFTKLENDPANRVVERLGLLEPMYFERCMRGLFSV